MSLLLAGPPWAFLASLYSRPAQPRVVQLHKLVAFGARPLLATSSWWFRKKAGNVRAMPALASKAPKGWR